MCMMEIGDFQLFFLQMNMFCLSVYINEMYKGVWRLNEKISVIYSNELCGLIIEIDSYSLFSLGKFWEAFVKGFMDVSLF